MKLFTDYMYDYITFFVRYYEIKNINDDIYIHQA